MYPIIRIGENFYLPSYFTVIALAYCVAIFYLNARAIRFQLSSKMAMELAVIIMLVGFIGARLFHVFYELPDYYLQHPSDVLKIWQGGFVFYGGALSAGIVSLWFLKKQSQDVLQWLDALAPIVPLTYFFGRFATLLSGSGYGKPTDLPWAITYPPGTEAPAGIPLHPTPVYAMLWEFSVFFLILWLEKKTPRPRWLGPGGLFFCVMIFHGVGRFIMEQLRNDLRGATLLGLTVSSWISIVVLGSGIYFLIRYRQKVKTKTVLRVLN